VESQEKRLDRLIRQGMMPARQLPILHRALASVKMGKVLTPYERDALSKLIDSMMGFTFGDDIAYNRARLHTQKTKYQTEESEMVSEEERDGVVIYDGTKDEQEAMKEKDKKSKDKADGKKKKKNTLTDTNGPGQSNAEEENMKEENARGANRPADKQEGDKESPKQGGSVVPEITDGPKQTTRQDAEEPSSHSNVAKVSEGRPSIGEGLVADLDAEGQRSRMSRRFKRAGKASKEKLMKGMSKSVRKEKMKESTITKDIEAFNAAYKEHLTKSLEDHGVGNIRDIPQAEKKEFFDDLDETITKKHLKMAKGIAFDKRYAGSNYSGAARQMEKIHKGLSDHPETLKHLKHANEQIEHPLDEGSLKDYALGHGYFDNSGEGKRKRSDKDWLSKQAKHGKKTLPYPKKKLVSDRKEEVEMEGTMVPGFIGADGKATSKPTKKDFAANKEYQGMKKKLGNRIPGPAVKEDNISEGGIGGSVKLKDAEKVAKGMEKSMGLKKAGKTKDGQGTVYKRTGENKPLKLRPSKKLGKNWYHNEETREENIDEVSDKTLVSYIKKRGKEVSDQEREVDGPYAKGYNDNIKSRKGIRMARGKLKEASAKEIFKKRMASKHPDDNPQATKRIDDDKGGMKTYKMHPGAKFQPGTGDVSQKGKTAAIKKQHERRPKDYGITEDSEVEENPFPKSHNEKVKDLHNTIRGMYKAGDFETLVVDPNVELQAETDRIYNNVQEGAREDAMRDIKNDDKGLAPLKKDTPDPKKSKHDGSANKGPEHIVSQMRKAVSLGDKHDGVKFKDGKTHKVSSAHAHKFLNKYMDSKPEAKTKMQDHAHASHDNFKTHID